MIEVDRPDRRARRPPRRRADRSPRRWNTAIPVDPGQLHDRRRGAGPQAVADRGRSSRARAGPAPTLVDVPGARRSRRRRAGRAMVAGRDGAGGRVPWRHAQRVHVEHDAQGRRRCSRLAGAGARRRRRRTSACARAISQRPRRRRCPIVVCGDAESALRLNERRAHDAAAREHPLRRRRRRRGRTAAVLWFVGTPERAHRRHARDRRPARGVALAGRF